MGLLNFSVMYLDLGELVVTREGVKHTAEPMKAMLLPFKQVLTEMGFGDKPDDRVINGFVDVVPLPSGSATLWEATVLLLSSGHLYTVVGSTLIFFCVLLLPVAEASVVTAMAWQATAPPEEAPLFPDQRTKKLYRLSRVLAAVSDLAMLDVFVIGVLIAFYAVSSVHVLQAKLQTGYWLLLVTMAVGVLHHALCGAAVLMAEKKIEQTAPRQREEGGVFAGDEEGGVFTGDAPGGS